VFDDVHWADQASVDLLVHLFRVTETRSDGVRLRAPARAPVARLADQAEAEAQYAHRYTEIVLSPLDAQRTNDLVSALLNIADLPAICAQLIIQQDRGQPYFIEEVVRSLIEQGIVYQTDDGCAGSRPRSGGRSPSPTRCRRCWWRASTGWTPRRARRCSSRRSSAGPSTCGS
jgi:predicted ATPase